jgi:predicted dehydrogenase
MNFLIGDQLKVGVIGAGRWGKKHIDEYSKMK